MKFTDSSGWVRAAVCCAALLVHHGLRDSLITALPTLAVSPATAATTTTTASPSLPERVAFTTRTITIEASLPINKPLTGENTASSTFSKAQPKGSLQITNKTTRKLPTVSDGIVFTHTSPSAKPTESSREYNSKHSGSSSSVSVLSFAVTSENKDIQDRRLWSGRESTPPEPSPTSERKEVIHNEFYAKQAPRKHSENGNPGRVSKFPPPWLSKRSQSVLTSESGSDRTKDRPSRRTGGQDGLYSFSRFAWSDVIDPTRLNHFLGYEKPSKMNAAPLMSVPVMGNKVYRTKDGNGNVEEVKEEEVEAEWFSLRDFQFKEEWSLVVEGAVLSAVYWGWLLTALLADPLIGKVGAGVTLGVSVGVTGLLGLLTHAASLGGPWALLGLRVVQGAFQGVGYPAVVRVLEGLPEASRAPASLLVYFGPYLGTSLGAGLGALRHWYVATYVIGGLALPLVALCLMLPPPPSPNPHKEMLWKSVLGCRAVWACVGVHVADTWMFHTLLVGLPFCLVYSDLNLPKVRGWSVAAAALAVGVVVRLLLLLAPLLSTKGPSALNRRRIPIMTGSVMVVAATIVMATAGLNSAVVLVSVGVGLAGAGVGVVRVGYRLNVEDVAPCQAWRVTRLLDLAAVVAAAVSPVVLTAMAQGGGKWWAGVWVVPLAALLPAGGLFLFFLTANPQSWDQPGGGGGGGGGGSGAVREARGGGGGGGGSTANGTGPPLSIGRQSFKSARSGLTFKTAMSRPRTRTMSCRTIDEDLDGDMRSVVDEASVECRSVVEEADPECVSVISSNTFKSDGADMHSVLDGAEEQRPGQQFGSMLANGGVASDRTSAWLSSHHDLVIDPSADQSPPTKADIHRRNAIYGLLW